MIRPIFKKFLAAVARKNQKPLTMSNNGIRFLKNEEGKRLTAYKDSVGVWTIGYGHTGPEVVQGYTITEQQAEDLLKTRLANEFEPVVRPFCNADTLQHEFDALVSLCYNIGVHGFAKSTAAREHKKGNRQNTSLGILMWHSHGLLVKRRKRESDLYLTGFYAGVV